MTATADVVRNLLSSIGEQSLDDIADDDLDTVADYLRSALGVIFDALGEEEEELDDEEED